MHKTQIHTEPDFSKQKCQEERLNEGHTLKSIANMLCYVIMLCYLYPHIHIQTHAYIYS